MLGKTFRGHAFALAFVLLALNGAAPSQLTIVASTYDSPVRAGGHVMIRLVITNQSSRDVILYDTERACDYDVEVKRVDGSTVPLTASHSKRRCTPNAPAERNIRVVIRPQESSRDGVWLNEFVDLTADTYTVRVGRTPPPSLGGEEVWSNTLTIIVTPSSQPAVPH